MWDLIVSVPGHCLSFYSAILEDWDGNDDQQTAPGTIQPLIIPYKPSVLF